MLKHVASMPRTVGCILCLGSPVVPFYPISFWVRLLKPNSRKKGTLIIKGLLGNLVAVGVKASEPEEPRGSSCIGCSEDQGT